ncbi:ribonuclease HII [Candidatus Dojkabacteria bacterium]|nr:ribonuclease HII [Candidatus Dojkabacteria bacterium]
MTPKDSTARFSNFSLEYEYLSSGCKYVAGMDEVGRGCLAGPVVAAVAVISKEDQYIPGVWDSKTMTAKRREDVYDQLLDTVDAYGIGEASCAEIDELGIGPASSLAMQRAYDVLDIKPDIVLIDGEKVQAPNLHSRHLKQGDRKHFIISVSSVIAKVYRDRMMIKLSKQYSGYGFEKNVGYGTKEHRLALESQGVCEIHRKTFSPVKDIISKGKFYEKGSG